MSMSADGSVAGPEQSAENPLGVGGQLLHEWHLGPTKDHPVNRQVMADMLDNMGATIMGRNMFGPIRGEWPDEDWTGWWGDNPPYHNDVFVLTHYAREPAVMEGGTTFHFVTDGVESALDRAREAARDQDVLIAGGASVIRQYLRLGLIDQMHLAYAPILLGGGERIFDQPGDGAAHYECVGFVPTEAAIHTRFARKSDT
jgi:dihydrofolate reductase